MIKRFILVAVAMMAFMTMMAQNSVTLTFTGQDLNHDYAPLSYVEIDNYSRGWSERIYFPDTIFTMTVGSGIDDYQRDPGEMQVMPNPFDGKTTVNFHSTKNETVKLLITDISGRQYAEYQGSFVAGDNMFSIVLTTPQTYILSLQTGSGMTRSVKMINVGRGEKNLIRKEENMKNPAAVNLKTLSTNPFELGDQMCYTGYAINYAGEVVSGTPIIKQQYTNETILFILPINPILPTVTTNPPTNVMETCRLNRWRYCHRTRFLLEHLLKPYTFRRPQHQRFGSRFLFLYHYRLGSNHHILCASLRHQHRGYRLRQ